MMALFLLFFYWQVNQKMILTLTASIMYWSLQQPVYDSDSSSTASFSRGASPEPLVDEAPSPASISISDAIATATNGCASPASVTTPCVSPAVIPTNGTSYPNAEASHDTSPTPSVCGDDDGSVVSEISQLTMDDTASDAVVSALADDPVSDTATSAPPSETEEAQLPSE